jgi:tetratricopeptide (TPR) repeat protein
MDEDQDHLSGEPAVGGLSQDVDFWLAEEPSPRPGVGVELVAPTPVSLRADRRDDGRRSAPAMIALTADALWIQETWRLRKLPVPAVESIGARRNGEELTLGFGPNPAADTLILRFASAQEGERWKRKLQALRERPTPEGPSESPYVPQGVALVRRAPDVPRVDLGRVAFMHRTGETADRGLQLRAGILGADAVVDVRRKKCPEAGWGARQVSGLAVQVEDGEAQDRLRLKWYAEEVNALVNRMALFVIIQATALFLAAALTPGISSLEVATGETLAQSLASAGLSLPFTSGWPLVLLALIRSGLRWPQVLRMAGIGVLALATGRGLTVSLAHLLAVATTGATLAESKIWILADPVDWAFIIFGLVYCRRAWRLASRSSQILPREAQFVSTSRKPWSRGLRAVTGVYALAILAAAGVSRYRASEYLLQSGVDPRREHQALLAFDEGIAHDDAGDLPAAARALTRSLRVWEELASRPSSPASYRVNLAVTLNYLGWIRQRQGHGDEAEKYYTRTLALGDELAGDPKFGQGATHSLEAARRALAGLRNSELATRLDEKDHAAFRKYEEARVKAQKGEPGADGLYREVIAEWEEVLSRATSHEYRKGATARLAGVYLELAEFQQQFGKHSASEPTLEQAIAYGEKAVALDPDRPLPKHDLEVARQMREELREQQFQDELAKLGGAKRFADAARLFQRSIADKDREVRLGKDRTSAVRFLAYRLDRFAWFLAHCPEESVRDTKAAVRYAGRATGLRPDVKDYWYTLATVQYRNSDWRDSLASLERVKVKAGAFSASEWLLLAMNRQQLKQPDAAWAAYRKAIEWIDQRKGRAEGDAVLRFQFEMMRPVLEPLLREAESLLGEKAPAGEGVG